MQNVNNAVKLKKTTTDNETAGDVIGGSRFSFDQAELTFFQED